MNENHVDYYADPMGLMDRLSRGLVSPQDVLEEMKRSPMIFHCVELWKHGRMTWEQAMMLCVVKLNEQVRELQKSLRIQLENTPFPPIIVGSKSEQPK